MVMVFMNVLVGCQIKVKNNTIFVGANESEKKSDKLTKKLTYVKPDETFVRQKGIHQWPVWEKEESDFHWSYDITEECYILEGEFDILTDEGVFAIGKGDFVTFHKGLTCRWIIRKKVRKHYNFIND